MSFVWQERCILALVVLVFVGAIGIGVAGHLEPPRPLPRVVCVNLPPAP